MSQLKLSGDASGTGIVTVAAPNTNSTYTVTLPAAAGTIVTGAAGSDTQVQFNDSGSFGGDAGLTYNKTTDTLTAGGISVTGNTTLGDAVGDTLTVNATATFNNADATIYGVRVGRGAGAVSTNTAVGASALATNSTGSFNTAVGWQALLDNTTASGSTAVGYRSLENSTASANTAVGDRALVSNTSGANNTAVGTQALTENTTASNNTAIGYQALYANTGANNTAVGYDAGSSTTTGAKNTFLGRSAKASAATTDNEIVLGYNVVGQGDGYVTIGQGGLGKIYNAYYVNATWTQTSDGTMKNIVGPDTLGLSFINRLNPIKFTWKPQNELPTDHPYYAETNAKNTTTVIHGFVAQEVKAALDAEGCTTFNGWDQGPDGIQAISREMFISPLVKAVQELSAQVQALQAEIAALKGA